jgi:hypothetical protein
MMLPRPGVGCTFLLAMKVLFRLWKKKKKKTLWMIFRWAENMNQPAYATPGPRETKIGCLLDLFSIHRGSVLDWTNLGPGDVRGAIMFIMGTCWLVRCSHWPASHVQCALLDFSGMKVGTKLLTPRWLSSVHCGQMYLAYKTQVLESE